MWIHLISLATSLLVVNIILPHITPKLKKIEYKNKKTATEKNIVFPDKGIKLMYTIFISFFWLMGLLLVFIPQICELLGFEWLIANIIYWTSLLLVSLLFAIIYQVTLVEYNDEHILVISRFRKNKIYYSDIIKTKGNFIIITKRKKYYIPHAFFYGVDGLKENIMKNTIK